MSEENFLDYNEEESEFSEQVKICREAFSRGELAKLDFSEEEFDTLLGFFADEYEDKLLLALSRIACQRYPYSSELIVKYSDALIINEEPEKAVEILEHQLGLNSSNSDVYFLLGRGEIKMKNFEIARQYINHALIFSPDGQDDMLSSIALDFMEAAQYDLALEYLMRVYKNNSEDIIVCNDIAFCLERTERYEESLEYYYKCIEADPFNSNIWFNIGTVNATIEEFDKAIEAFDYSLALEPDNSSVMYNKAVVFLNLSQYDKAVDILKDFLVYEPDDYSALTAIADCYLKLGQGDKAEKYMKMLLELDQNNIEAYTSLAYISLVRQEYDKSLDYLRIIIGGENVNYNLLEDDLFMAFQKTDLPEFLVYFVVAAYFMDDQEGLLSGFEQLLKFDELWQNMLYKLVPELNFFTENT